MEITSYVLSFRMVFFYLVTKGWIFDISLCENSIIQSINQSKYEVPVFPSMCCRVAIICRLAPDGGS